MLKEYSKSIVNNSMYIVMLFNYINSLLLLIQKTVLKPLKISKNFEKSKI